MVTLQIIIAMTALTDMSWVCFVPKPYQFIENWLPSHTNGAT